MWGTIPGVVTSASSATQEGALKQQVLVFSLGALAAFGLAGWVRSGRPVAVVPNTFQTQEPVAASVFASTPIVQSGIEAAPVAIEPAWQEPASVRARPAAPRTIRRAALTSAERDDARSEQPEPARTEEPKLRTRDSRPVEEDASIASQRDASGSQPTSVSRPDPVIRERSKKASAAIIAGSAAAGAAIGAAAGGGKGAAIGAISGAAGGYVYDRMTHRRRDSADTRDSTVRDTSGYRDSDIRNTGEDTKMDTLRRVGIGAASGAAIGGLAGRGKGAAIGAVTGGAAGYIYDRIRRR